MAAESQSRTSVSWIGGMGRKVDVTSAGSVELICTPSQHGSARTAGNSGQTLWCSWVLKETAEKEAEQASPLKKLFFAGDTGYRHVSGVDSESDKARHACPAFAEIGSKFGPIDLALLPIGCFLPRAFMSTVHASPEDSICIHKDIRSKRSYRNALWHNKSRHQRTS